MSTTTYGHDSDRHMPGSRPLRSLYGGHVLVLCILP